MVSEPNVVLPKLFELSSHSLSAAGDVGHLPSDDARLLDVGAFVETTAVNER